jgi:altronate hydrolase
MVHDLERQDYAIDRPLPPDFPADLPRTFLGYRRPDGRVGTRNYIAVVAASSCASHVCLAIADAVADVRGENLHGVVALPHNEGCGTHDGPDIEQLERTLKGICVNPNVAATLMVGLGCEINHLARYAEWGSRSRQSRPFAQVEIQSAGGTVRTIAEGVRIVREMADLLRAHERSEQAVSRLVLGLNCGGSDAFSGITANPALGWAADLLVAASGTAVLAETAEIYGAEQSLTRRAVDVRTGEQLVHAIRRYKEYVARFGATLDSNPSIGNRRGGITNIVEKSLGAVTKGGTTMLTAVVDYAEQVAGPGLVFMDTPGYDPVSLTGIAAGGCSLIAFTTGRGSAIGFPVVPVLKIASNSATFLRMHDNMDVNAGEIVDGKTSIRDVGVEIYRRLVSTASGRLTKAEILGHREFAPWRIGPVM